MSQLCNECGKPEESCICIYCESCGELVTGEKVTREHHRITQAYCSEDCAHDAEEDLWVGHREAAREFEIYGDDFDSWFR